MTSSGLPAELTREQLYDLVWSEPMLRVAERFGVSSSYMARVCAMLDIPRPERGYWAKLAAGKKKPKPLLPEIPIGYSSSLSLSGHEIKVTKSLPRPVGRRKTKKSVGNIRPSQHPLLVGVKEHFSAGRLSYEGEYLKPSKRLLVDLVVAKTGLDKAITFANELFLELEGRGHRVVFRPDRENLYRASVDERMVPVKRQGYFKNNLWSPSRCTVVYIGTLAIGLTIVEMSEDVAVRYVNGEYVREENYIPSKRKNDYTFTTNKQLPTGRLRLQAYSPYSYAGWVTCWEETKTVPLTDRVSAIAKKLERDAVELAKLVKEGACREELQRQEWARQQEQWRREEAERRVIRARKESLDDLNKVIEKWSEVTRVEKFFEAAEQSAAKLPSEERSQLLEKLKLARDLIGTTNALEHFLTWKAPDERVKTPV